MQQQPKTWTIDFMADMFTDRLRPTEEWSSNDALPTNCSFGRGKRMEDMPIPRMPKVLLHESKKNVPGIGRGLQRKANSSHSITKPGMVHSWSKPDQKTDLPILQERNNPQHLAVTMEPLFLDQKCPRSIPTAIIPIDRRPLAQQIQGTGQYGLDMENEEEFPSLSMAADKEPTSKQTKIKSQKKKNKKKS